MDVRGHFTPPYTDETYTDTCAEINLIIELDGGHHSESSVSQQDTERIAFLTEAGYRVLKFWNNDVLVNLEGVVYVIQQTVETLTPALSSQILDKVGTQGEDRPTPQPSPDDGRGEEQGLLNVAGT